MRRTGEGNLGCILTGAIFAIGLMIAWQAVPTKIRSAEFYDFMIDQAEAAGSREAAQIKKRLLAKADELDLPVNEKNLSVKKGGDRIKIETKYTIPLEYPGYTYEWTFDHKIDRAIFYF